MRRHAFSAALTTALLAATGCGFDGTSDPSRTDPPINSSPLGDGRIFISWTVGGATPTHITCGAIDHLSLKLDFRSGIGVKVEPIPCVLDRFRYDGLPTGTAQLALTAFDSAGCVLSSGGTTLSVSPTQPKDPSPTVALAALRACP